MTAVSKSTPRWKVIARRMLRPTPFWRKRLEDQIEPELNFSWVWDAVTGPLLYVIVGGVFIAALALFVVGPIFLSPGFVEHGLADPIARGLAWVCASTGECDLPYLMGGTVLAVVTLAVMGLTVARSVWVLLSERDDDDEVSEGELLAALEVLDERIVHLRADLVVAGVLKVSEEEVADE